MNNKKIIFLPSNFQFSFTMMGECGSMVIWVFEFDYDPYFFKLNFSNGRKQIQFILMWND